MKSKRHFPSQLLRVWIALASTLLCLAGSMAGQAEESDNAVQAAIASNPVAEFPDTEIFLLDLRNGGPARNITQKPYYDNQPFFSADESRLLYAGASNGTTDIFEYDIASGKTRQLTHTPAFEFSPTLRPGSGTLVANWVAGELNSSGQLWEYENGVPKVRLGSTLTALAYYVWLGQDKLAAMVNEAHGHLLLIDLAKGEVKRGPVGDFPLPTESTGVFSFLRAGESEEVGIHIFDSRLAHDEFVTNTPGGNPYMTWMSDHHLLLARDNVVYRFGRRTQGEWEAFLRFDEPGLQHLSRLAISPSGRWLAIVSEQQKP